MVRSYARIDNNFIRTAVTDGVIGSRNSLHIIQLNA